MNTTNDNIREIFKGKGKDKIIRYMIWKEDIPEDSEKVLLHLVKRNSSSFRQVSTIRKDPNKCWIYFDSLPLDCPINEIVKYVLRQNFIGNDYQISGNTIMILSKHLDSLYELINRYVEEYTK